MLHTPSSSSPSENAIAPCNKLIQDVKQDHILDKRPNEVVDVALEMLQNLGFQPVEWRSLLYQRMSVPVIVLDFSFLVPDDDLKRASDLLTRMGLPLSPPDEFFLDVFGDFHAKGLFHRITQTTGIPGVQHMTLYPMSFSTLSPADLIEQTPFHIRPSRCSKILVPRPPAIFASLIRLLASYPEYCSTRTNLCADLSELVGYHLYGLSGGYVDPFDEGAWEKLEVDRRIQEAGQLICQWSIEEEWRSGEEWIVDALWAIALGANIDNLPYKT